MGNINSIGASHLLNDSKINVNISKKDPQKATKETQEKPPETLNNGAVNYKPRSISTEESSELASRVSQQQGYFMMAQSSNVNPDFVNNLLENGAG